MGWSISVRPEFRVLAVTRGDPSIQFEGVRLLNGACLCLFVRPNQCARLLAAV